MKVKSKFYGGKTSRAFLDFLASYELTRSSLPATGAFFCHFLALFWRAMGLRGPLFLPQALFLPLFGAFILNTSFINKTLKDNYVFIERQ